MYPGHDCVGCHRESDGPELIAAGTIYGIVDMDGSRTTEHDCFGVQGVQVTLTGGDGQVLRTQTNRAGNFFFEGPESSLVKPFTALIEYTLPDGSVSRQPMGTGPAYGGCAACHRLDAETTPGSVPGVDLDADEVIQVFPLFTGPLVVD